MRTTGGFLITHYDQSLFLSGDNRGGWAKRATKGWPFPIRQYSLFDIFLAAHSPHSIRFTRASSITRRSARLHAFYLGSIRGLIKFFALCKQWKVDRHVARYPFFLLARREEE